MHAMTTHADKRCRQRGLADEQILLVLEHGTAIRTAGALFYFMAGKDIPRHIPSSMKERIAGITLVVDPESNELLTAYKNRHALKAIRKKVRYDNAAAFRERRSLSASMPEVNSTIQSSQVPS